MAGDLLTFLADIAGDCEADVRGLCWWDFVGCDLGCMTGVVIGESAPCFFVAEVTFVALGRVNGDARL